jgi:excisionase family DNA binding protein
MADSQPVFVRLPRAAAEQLERATQHTGLSKREVITRLVTEQQPGVGHHAFNPAPPPDVLTLNEAAELLRSDDATVANLIELGELPARRVGGEWRLARAAILDWLRSTEPRNDYELNRLRHD